MSAATPVICATDCSTGETIVRPMDAAELEQHAADIAAAAARDAQAPPPSLSDLIVAGIAAAVPGADLAAVEKAVAIAAAPTDAVLSTVNATE